MAAAACGPSGPSGEYTGSEACRACHASEFEAWQDSLHAVAAAAATPAQVLAPFDGVPRELASVSFVPQRREARLTIATGGATHEPALVLGRAEVEQLLVPAAGGRWQALPAGYDPEAGAWFDIFPEAPSPAAWAHWQNPGATANAQCLECHVTGFRKEYDPATDTYATRWHELGIGCEACHGPGGAHVARPLSPQMAGAGGAAMPGCVFCHARRVVLAEPFDPGVPAADQVVLELLDSDLYHADGTLRGEAYEWTSFHLSRMATEGIRCSDCHEPHAGRLHEPGNALCLRCHDTAYDTPAHTHHAPASAGGECVACHMPPHVFMERDERRDHHIAPPDPSLAAALGAPDACTTCHVERDQAWAGRQVEAWFPAGGGRARRREVASILALGQAGDARAISGLIRLLADDALDVVRRASAARLLEPFATEPEVREALRAALAEADPLVRASAVRALDEDAALLPLTHDPTRSVRLETAFALREVDLSARAPAERRAIEQVFREWEAAQAALADIPETQFNLGVFRTARGDLQGAVAAYDAAIRLWPADLPPRQNRALVLNALGEREAAEAALTEMLALDPAWAPAHFTLGLLYAEASRWPEAVAALEACLAHAPAYPRAALNLGLAHAALGDTPAALARLEQAVDDPAARRDALRELVRLAHLAGDRALQERWLAEALRADPGVRDDPRLREIVGPAG